MISTVTDFTTIQEGFKSHFSIVGKNVLFLISLQTIMILIQVRRNYSDLRKRFLFPYEDCLCTFRATATS